MLSVSWFINRDKEPVQGILQITDSENANYVMTEFPSDTVKLETKRGEFKAVALKNLFEKVQLKSGWQLITAFSSDGAEISFSREELPQLYLAQTTEDETTYLRLIIPSDDFPNRWLKLVNKITVK